MTRLKDELRSLRSRIDEALADPADAAAREVLANKLRSLAADASRMGQIQLAEELSVVRAVIQSVGVLASLTEGDRRHLEDAFDRIVAYMDAERNREVVAAPPKRGAHPRAAAGMLRVLVVGASATAESLLSEDWAADDDAPALMVEQSVDASAARYDAKRKHPEVIVIDSDLGGARVLVDRLVSDDDTEEVPIIVLGKWDRAEDASAFIALGVARTLAKPVSPGALRRACLTVLPKAPGAFNPLGEMSLDALGARLSDELHRGLCDAAEDRLRRKAIQLGDGSEVLTVLWEAIARIRELVTAESRGMLKFENNAVIEALPSAGWLTGSARRPHVGRTSSLNEVREDGEPLPLDGFRICVAEDDLSTNWFLCGVLREAGATVTGYFDGRKALDHAYREFPDLLMTDIVMPELDGFALCRAVKRDVLLRSVPVLLLSWKADLLQRMRELGAGADGYLLKEASGKEILQRVQELLRPRRVIEARIAGGGTVRGRLDGLSAVALLKIVSKVRPMSRVSIRDARFLYEIELRAGRPVLATRTDEDGATTRGSSIIAALLGIGGGRFSVCDIDAGAALTVELDGSLGEQLVGPIARTRASQTFLTGTLLMRVHRVGLSEEILELCLNATPEPARSLVRAIAAGATPRDLIAEGRASAELVERVLCDAARQGAITSIQAASGEVLDAAIEREIAVMSGVELAADERGACVADAYVGLLVAEDDPPPVDVSDELIAHTPSDVVVDEMGRDELPLEQLGLADDGLREEPMATATPVIARAAVVHESPRTPLLTRVVVAEPNFAEVVPDEAEPDIIDDEDDVDDETPSHAVRSRGKRRRKKRRRRKERSRREPRTAHRDAYDDDDDYSDEPPAVTPTPAPRVRRERGPAFTGAPVAQEEPRLPRLPMPSAWAARGAQAAPAKKSSRWAAPLVFGIVGVGLAIGARYMREREPLDPPPPMIITPQLDEPGAAEVPAGLPPPQAPATPKEAVAPGEQPVELPLSKKEAAKLKKGQGLLEVVAGRGHKIFVDGVDVGRGPVVKVPVKATAQPHEIRVKMKGEERVRYVVVKPKTRLRIRVAPPWSR